MSETAAAVPTPTAVPSPSPVVIDDKPTVVTAANKSEVISKIAAKFDAANLSKTNEATKEVPATSAPTVTTPPATSTEEKTTTQTTEERIAARAAKLRERENSIAAREAKAEEAMRSARESVRQSEERLQLLKDIKNNPLEALKTADVTFEQLAQAVLNEGKATPRELEALKLAREAKESAEAIKKDLESQRIAAQNAQYDQAIQLYKQEMRELVAKNPDQYELVASQDAVEIAYDVALEYHNAYGKVLPPKEAIEVTESFLEQRANKMFETKKFKNKLQVSEKPKESKTLTNAHSETTLSPSPKSVSLDRDARLKKALSHLKYN